MIEVRATVRNLEDTKKIIEELGAEFKSNYAFTDIIYVPTSKPIDLSKDFVRIRVYTINNWPTKKVVLVRKKTEWSKDGKVGKVVLNKEFDTLEEAESFLKEEFGNTWRKEIDYFREGLQYQLDKTRLFLEKVKGLPPSIEIEAEDKDTLDFILSKFDIIEKLKDSLPEVMRKINQ